MARLFLGLAYFTRDQCCSTEFLKRGSHTIDNVAFVFILHSLAHILNAVNSEAGFSQDGSIKAVRICDNKVMKNKGYLRSLHRSYASWQLNPAFIIML